MPILTLTGCAPVPLAHYLKALGILRLVSEQADPAATGHWHRDQFVLTSVLDRERLLSFFLETCQPTTVMAPWNGGSGFHPKDNSKALEALLQSTAPRFQPYSAALRAAQQVLLRMNLGEKPTSEQKAQLLLLCRNALPESTLAWLDAAYVLTDDGAKYPPLLGTGGNDGRLEFTNNFMQRLAEVIDISTGSPLEKARAQLQAALFGGPIATPQSKAPVGQFLPGTAGGANATSGFDAPACVNPWDFILMIEGALLFAAASVKRLESTEPGVLAYPFSVRQAGVGYASAADADESASRAEMWLPLWSSPVTLGELSAIFAEGRAQIGRRPAKNGVDFARAVTSLGVDRGLDEFQRYGFQVRNGLSYFATPLTRIAARRNASAGLLSEIDPWLTRFRSAVTKDTAPATVRRALHQLETAIIDLCLSDIPERLLQVLLALGQCQAAAAHSYTWASKPETYLPPLQGLSKAWLTPSLWAHPRTGAEFRLAASLASINGRFSRHWLPFRSHLEPVEITYQKTRDIIHTRWAGTPGNDIQWSQAPLPTVLSHIFARRLLKAPDPGKHFGHPASLADIKAFIEGQTDDTLLAGLLWSLSLINWRENTPLPSATPQRQPAAPTFYALLKLCYPPPREPLPDGILAVPSVPALHRLAATGQGTPAAEQALRRLRASGYRPLIKTLPIQGETARRTAAALLFPITDKTLQTLRHQITRPEKPEASQPVAGG